MFLKKLKFYFINFMLPIFVNTPIQNDNLYI